MKKKKMYLTMLLASAGVISCNQGGSEVITDSGMKYTVLKAGSEEIPAGSMMLVSFVAMDANDSVWMDSRPDGMPRPTRKLDSISTLSQGGLEEVLFYMKEGDSILCEVPIEKIYGNRPLPASMTKDSFLTVGIKIEEAMDEEAFQAYSIEMRAKQIEINAKKVEEQLTVDIDLIDAYLTENSIEAQKTESGLRYVITQEGQGEHVQSGQKIRANYAGHVLNAAFFDTCIEEVARKEGLYQEGRTYEPYPTVIGQGAVIRGWDEAFQLMNTGSKATLYIPSGLAYGPRARSAKIPANAILVFDVELVEIIAE